MPAVGARPSVALCEALWYSIGPAAPCPAATRPQIKETTFVSDVQDRRDSGASTDGAAIDTTTDTTTDEVSPKGSAKAGAEKAKSSKALRREALQRAAAKRAAARRRRNIILAFVGVLAVAGAVIGLITSGRGDKTPNNASASSSASAPGADASAPNQAASLPAGTDPKLSTKPSVGPGTGALTKLVVTPLVEGKGEPVKAGQTLTVNYVGVSYTDGKEFDSSWSGSGPVSFPIGVGQLIKGWDQGLIGVKVGSRVQLDIPSDLAYGDAGQVPGPLRFVVDVLSAK
jgi:peptidylprolyl isomerase